ncbi:MAG: hypothetical protein KF891_11660 [Rhizobacter sp.]|nr:hypothetical protein [Rhizobacter sp.]
MKIFWSWQSDTPSSIGRDLVKSALKEAIKLLAEELDLAEAERPELDHDTKDVPGLAPIADTIFEKIDKSAIFIADVTLVGSTPDGKKTPNPNVMIELGYAMKSLGPGCLVLVANSAGGFRPEDLPFDLRHRRGPITYELADSADRDARSKAQKSLVKDLTGALRVNLTSLAPAPIAEPPQYTSLADDRSIWFDPSQILKVHDGENGSLQHGATKAYLRISASGWQANKPTRREIHDQALSPFGPWRHGTASVQNEFGVMTAGWGRSKEEITALTQWFDKTAEIWGVSPIYGFERDGLRQFADIALLKEWRIRLREWIQLFDALGARKPLRVEAGITGMQGLHWSRNDFLERPKCFDAEVVHVTISKDWSEEAQFTFLMQVVDKICDAFAIRRLTGEQVARLIA